MSDIGYIKGSCRNCGGHLEFPPTGMGLTVDCPHCGGQTTLISNPPAAAAPAGNPPAQPGHKFPFLRESAVLLLLLAAAGGVLYWLPRPGTSRPPLTPTATLASTNADIPNGPAPAPEADDLVVTGPVTLQKTEGSTLIYAVGTVRNNSDRQRFGVKIELDLLDHQDHKIGTAGDYLAILEAHKDWPFRALLTQPRTVKATVAKIEEQK